METKTFCSKPRFTSSLFQWHCSVRASWNGCSSNLERVARDWRKFRTILWVEWLQEGKNLKWILAISIVLFFLRIRSFLGLRFFGVFFSLPFHHLPPQYTAVELAWYFINQADILLFLLTITSSTLFTAGFKKWELLYRLSIYLFTLSMGLFVITLLQMLVGLPYRS